MFTFYSTSHIPFTMAANSLLLSFSQVETQKSKPLPPELPIHRRWISSSQYEGVGAQQVFEAYLPSENEGGWGKESFLPAILRTSLSTVFTYLGKQGDTCMNYTCNENGRISAAASVPNRISCIPPRAHQISPEL